MGNQKQKWTAEEEEALLAGVAKHGPGKWKNILKDPDFAPSLTSAPTLTSSLVCCGGRRYKDKWRNLSVSTSTQGSRDKSRAAPKVKAIVASLPNTPNSAPAASRAHNVSTDTAVGDPSNSALDGKNAPRHPTIHWMISLHDPNANMLNINKDVNHLDYILQQRQEVPPNFRRLLSSRLRRLVSQGKLEKIQNCYKIRKDTLMGMKTPSPKQKDIRLRQNSGETVEEAAITAAYKVAEAENKSFLAAEAVKEAERVSKMAEDTDSMLQLVKEIYEQCSRGEIVLVA
ncbi:hypothetical protein REPUB_Repub13aG0190100 [Reevesia pubescens]